MESTCFINAVLQALFHCTVFTDWLNSKEVGDLPLKMQLKKLDTSSTTTDVLIQYAQFYSIFKDKIELIKNSTLGRRSRRSRVPCLSVRSVNYRKYYK